MNHRPALTALCLVALASTLVPTAAVAAPAPSSSSTPTSSPSTHSPAPHTAATTADGVPAGASAQTDAAPPRTGDDTPGATMNHGVAAPPTASSHQSSTLESAAGGRSGASTQAQGTTESDAQTNVAAGVAVYGMDVSGWQSSVDWAQQYRLGARFVSIKATEGSTYVSGSYSSQFTGSTAAGLKRGGYHFALPSQSSGAAQARFFLANGGGWSADGKTMPGLLDLEWNPYTSLGDSCYGMTPAQLRSWTQDFTNTYKAATGRAPAIYTAASWWNSCVGSSTASASSPLHVANYSNSPNPLPTGWSRHDLWQYSDQGLFDGDSNVFNGTTAGLQNYVTRADYDPSNPTVQTPAAASPTVKGAIGGYYRSRGGAAVFGTPNHNEVGGLPAGGVYQQFSTNKTIYWSPATGAADVDWRGGIGALYRARGYERGLGYPTTPENKGGSTAWQAFHNPVTGQRSVIYWSSLTGAHVLTEGTGIGTWFAQHGREWGTGFPSSEETATGTGAHQFFRNVSTNVPTLLLWSASTGTHAVMETHGIGAKWAASGREQAVGYPSGEESAQSGGVAWQGYRTARGQKNTIIWTSRTGAHLINETGGIGAAYSRAGREKAWGVPTTDEYRGTDGKVHQKFSKGVEVVWSPTALKVLGAA